MNEIHKNNISPFPFLTRSAKRSKYFEFTMGHFQVSVKPCSYRFHTAGVCRIYAFEVKMTAIHIKHHFSLDSNATHGTAKHRGWKTHPPVIDVVSTLLAI